FIACGSITDPQKDYHLEFAMDDAEKAAFTAELITSFDIEAKIVNRKKYNVVYLKDGEHIVDVLNIMGAHVSLMELENVRIVKELRNSINRRVNCEAANIGKTTAAANRQIEDIRYLNDTIGLDSLSDELRTTALLRLEYPEASLAELGEKHDRKVGRSGVNHRLQKLTDMAERLRSGKP
ncbi:MAG: DNA-binding protein WhiA, partial [Lachnospiraceae bacterium]|nr:DNA-binding protein WhiA [Lachnospiraceae bacterium]